MPISINILRIEKEKLKLSQNSVYALNFAVFKGLTFAGDVNGDGLNDVAASSSSGYVVIIYGQKSADDEILLSAADETQILVLVDDESDDGFGYGVDLCTDLNGDGRRDLLITGQYGIYVYYTSGEKADNVDETVSASNDNGFVLPYDSLNVQQGAAKCIDVNNDGVSDILFLATDSDKNIFTQVVYGQKASSMTTLETVTTSEGFRFVNTDPYAIIGFPVVSTPSWRGDNSTNIVLAAPLNKTIYIVYGNSSTFAVNSGISSFTVDTMTSSQGSEITNLEHPAYLDFWGAIVDASGDINGDGLADFLISNYLYQEFYIVYGQCGTGYHLSERICCPEGQTNVNGVCQLVTIESKKRLSGGQIAGIVLGCVGFTAVVAAAIIIAVKKGLICGSSASAAKHTGVPQSPTIATSA